MQLREPFKQFVVNELNNGLVLIACGLPATWKTETTEEISRIKGYPLLRTDLFRLDVLKNEDIFDEKVASNMDKRLLVYEAMFHASDQELNRSKGVILDATFITQALRKRAAQIADKHDVRFVILQTSCPQEVSIRRIMARTKEKYESNALTEQAYLNNKEKFEKVDIDDLKKQYPKLNILHFLVDTTLDPPEDWYVIETEKR
jgi:predicted kinase